MNIPHHLRILFFKSHVRAYTTKHGVFVAAHEDKRQKKAVPGHKRVENQDGTDLFSAPAAPVADKVKKPTTRDLGKSRLDAFIKKHHGLPNLAHHIGQMTDAERQRIYTEMGKLGNKTPTEVSLMFRGVKPVSAVQEDLFAGPAANEDAPKKDDPNSEITEVKEEAAKHGMTAEKEADKYVKGLWFYLIKKDGVYAGKLFPDKEDGDWFGAAILNEGYVGAYNLRDSMTVIAESAKKEEQYKAKKPPAASGGEEESGAFGPIYRGYENKPEAAIAKLMAEKQGEAPGAFHHPDLGAITFAYGDANMGLRHIEKKRGIEYVNRIPDVLRKGRLLRDKKLPRAYLVTDDNPPHVVTIRLDFDGKAKTWVITSFDDDWGKFNEARNPQEAYREAGVGDSRIPESTGQTQSSPSVAKNQPAAWEEDDEESQPVIPTESKAALFLMKEHLGAGWKKSEFPGDTVRKVMAKLIKLGLLDDSNKTLTVTRAGRNYVDKYHLVIGRPLAKSLPPRYLFLKSLSSPAPIKAAPAKAPAQAKAPAAYGHHNVDEGDALHFAAGSFKGKGKVKSVGESGAVLEDDTGRDHNVHWHEITGRYSTNSKPEPARSAAP